MTPGLVFHGAVRPRAASIPHRILLALLAASCHKEQQTAAPDDDACFGARCVEQAEAAMYYKDYASAREPLAAVCENKDGFACFRLAELHQHGRGGPVDLAKAAEYYEQACGKEYPEGCERRSDLAREGQGSPEIELEYALKACDGGRAMPCARAGEQLAAGRGIDRDDTRAIEMFEKACNLGEVTGCTSAGDLLSQPERSAEAKTRSLSAFIRACVGHSAYGCLKAGVAFHDGIGTSVDLDKAQSHFARACEWSEQDGCHAAKQLADSAGKPVELELTTKADELGQAGLKARSVRCRMTEVGQPALDEVFSAVASSKESLDACAKDGAAVAVTLQFADGRVYDAKIKGKPPKKLEKCVVTALRRAKISPTGTCEAVLMLGDPDGAERSLAAATARQQAAKDRNTVHVGDADEE